MQSQLTLALDNNDGKTFASFHAADNSLLLDRLQRFSECSGDDQQLLLWGVQGSGKTHLLNACCHWAAHTGHRVAYVPAELITSASIFEGLEYCRIVCVDDVDRIPRSRELELALFGLINATRQLENRLLFASGCSPQDLSIHLPDLRTRLSWGATYAVQALGPADVREALKSRAHMAGLVIDDHVLDYLLNNFPRDIGNQSEQLQRLDQASLQTQRRITIPLVRQVLLSESD